MAGKYLITVLYMVMAALQERRREGERRDESKYPGSQAGHGSRASDWAGARRSALPSRRVTPGVQQQQQKGDVVIAQGQWNCVGSVQVYTYVCVDVHLTGR